MRNRFTEQDTEAFYDAEDALYRSFWDSEGSLHWGWFDPGTGDDFLKACANLNRNMAEKAEIQVSSQVLDMGCGNGTTATWLAKTIGCSVTGIDLSGVRIGNAIDSLRGQPADLQQRLGFEKASATELPLDAVVTGQELRARIVLPNGFEFKEAEMANTAYLRIESAGPLVFQHTDTYGALNEFDWSNG